MYLNRTAEKIIIKFFDSRKILIILGARQVGKTTMIKKLLNGKDSLFLNLDIEVDMQRLKSVSVLPPAKAMDLFGTRKYLIIDEAQRLPEIGKITKSWYDAEVETKIILLGSSSLDLLNKSSESLTGRNEKIYLTPFSFAEVLEAEDWYEKELPRDIFYDNFSDQIYALLFENVVYGGYPELASVKDKKAYLLNLTSDYLFKDVLQLGLIKTPDLIKRLLSLLAHQIGSEVSVNELSKNLGVARQTIEKYLDLLTETFVIFSLSSYSTNQRKEIAKSKKYYFWDTGVRNAVLNDFSPVTSRIDIGVLWENWVVAEFAKRNITEGKKKDLYFWRSRSGSEIDLVIKEDNNLSAYEIKWGNKKVKPAGVWRKAYPKATFEVINKDNYFRYIN